MAKPTVFISYSHKDENWKDRLVTQLGVLEQHGLLELWHDRLIGAGQDWLKRIRLAIGKAHVAVLLVSAHSLTSKFILRKEVKHFLMRRLLEGMHIVAVILSPCDWQGVSWLRRMQVRPRDGRPLSAGRRHEAEKHLADIVKEIRALLKQPHGQGPLRGTRRVPLILVRHHPKKGFVATSPVFPELVSGGNSLMETVEMLSEALHALAEVYKLEGKTEPALK
jgi:predicted RNase H-like HicB family nuclease